MLITLSQAASSMFVKINNVPWVNVDDPLGEFRRPFDRPGASQVTIRNTSGGVRASAKTGRHDFRHVNEFERNGTVLSYELATDIFGHPVPMGAVASRGVVTLETDTTGNFVAHRLSARVGTGPVIIASTGNCTWPAPRP